MSSRICFIVEGLKTEPEVIENIKKLFFKDSEVEVIHLPAMTNIYSIYKALKNDDFETGIIEIVKEQIDKNGLTNNYSHYYTSDFSEVYLLFDYDAHNNNIPHGLCVDDVIEEMLEVFDNETENGKLLISYPMVEAIKDNDESANVYLYPVSLGRGYKKVIDSKNHRHIKAFGYDDWVKSVKKHMLTLSYLRHNLVSVEEAQELYPMLVYYDQKKIGDEYIASFSGVVEFLIEYFHGDKLLNKLNITEKELNRAVEIS